MGTLVTSSKPFKVGTTGWTADDLDDPQIARQWDRGRYEIVDGVLTQMSAAYFDGTVALDQLQKVIQRRLDQLGDESVFAHEVDFIVQRRRVAKADMMMLTVQDMKSQLRAVRDRARPPGIRFGRWLVPPTLVVESLSPGHEAHDRETKYAWYAQAGVRNYWLLNAMQRELECLVLQKGQFAPDVHGRGNDQVRPSLLPQLVIPLADVWKPLDMDLDGI
jgi:hypothetical protein